MTGAYLRIEREGKWENIEVEYLTDQERQEIFIGKEVSTEKNEPRLLQWLNLVCNKLASLDCYIPMDYNKTEEEKQGE